MKMTPEEMAKTWMLGTRDGVEVRPAWKHPEDLVLLLRQMPGHRTEEYQKRLESIAWMHDLLEDGRKQDGTQVMASDLLDQGVEGHLVESVISLSQRMGEEKVTYLARLRSADVSAKRVKCIDRICNLREGAETFKNVRWARYLNETVLYVLPLIDYLPEPESSWLREQLLEAMARRTVY